MKMITRSTLGAAMLICIGGLFVSFSSLHLDSIEESKIKSSDAYEFAFSINCDDISFPCFSDIGSVMPTVIDQNCSPAPIDFQMAAIDYNIFLSTNGAGVTAPEGCPGAVYVVSWQAFQTCGTGAAETTFMAECEQNVTLTGGDPLAIVCPTSTTISACQSQTDVNNSFNIWLSLVSSTGGCDVSITNDNSGAPNACGGSTTVTFTATDGTCTNQSTSCTSTFTVATSAPLVQNCAPAINLAACSNQASILSSYNNWVAGFSVSGGCSPTTNIASIPTLPAYVCGAAVNLSFTYSVTDACSATAVTCTSTFTVASSTPLVQNCAPAVSLASCSSQASIQTSYNNWVAGFSVSGGCSPTTNIASIPALPTYVCGAAVNLSFTYSVTDGCNPTAVTCTSTFTVASSTPLVQNCAPAVSLASCSSQASIQTSYNNWVAGFTTSGGCSPVTNIASVPLLPTYVCGAAVNLSFTYSVTDGCNPTAVTCTSTFTVAPSTAFVPSCAPAVSLAACSSQASIASSYNNWVAGFTVSGGCNPITNIASIPALPAYVCGAAVNLSFTYSVTDGCNATAVTCTSTFTVAASTAFVPSCAPAVSLAACTSQASIQSSYNNWVASFTVSGGCSPVTNIASIPALPAYVCGAAVNLSFTYSVTDACSGTAVTCTSTFAVASSSTIVQNCAPAVSLTACSSQASIQASYNNWVAGFTVSGGCSPVTNIASIPALPAYVCGAAINLNFTYSATDACGGAALNCTSAFTVAASPGLVPICAPAVNLSACMSEAAITSAYNNWVAGFSVSGGCSPVTNIASIPALPTYVCGAAVNLSFTYSVTDACGSTAIACTSSFTVGSSTPIVPVCSPSMNLSSCMSQAAISTAYNNWVSGFAVSGGCNPVTNIASIPALPAYVCGAGINLSFTYSVTDGCNATAVSCTSNFTVASATPLVPVCSPSVNLSTCMSQAALTTAYNNWVAGFSVSGGCNPVTNIASIPALPAYVCGAAVNLSFTYSVTDGCNPTAVTCTSTFIVASSSVLVPSCAPAVNLAACSSQTAITTAYNNWVAGFTTSGGCNPISNIASIPALPAYVCGAPVNLSFTYSVTDGCNATAVSCTSTFVVASTILTRSCPAPVTISACSTPSNISTSYSTWVGGFTTNGGCNTTTNISSIPALSNNLCRDGINLNFIYQVTDLCNTTALTCSSSFNIVAAPDPTINCPAPIAVNACGIGSYVPALANVNLPCALPVIQISGSLGAYVGDCNGGTIDITYNYNEPGCATISRNCIVTVAASPATTITCPTPPAIQACDIPTYTPLNANVLLGCGGNSFVSGTPETFAPSCTVSNLYINYSFTDVCGMYTMRCHVQVLPPPAPTIACPTIPIVTTCNLTNFTAPDALVTLGCGTTLSIPGTGSGISMVPCSGGIAEIIYTYADVCSSVDLSCSVTITGDNLPPTLTCPPGLTGLTCGTPLPPALNHTDFVLAGGWIDDNCDTNPMIDFPPIDSADPTSLDFCAAGGADIIRTYSSTDDCGNVGTCTQVFSYIPDIIPPTIASCAGAVNLIVECGDPNIDNLINSWLSSTVATISAVDNCSGVTTGHTYVNGTYPIFGCGPINGLAVDFYADDACGNRAVCTARIVITDTQAPVVRCPDAITGLTCIDDVPTPANSQASYIALTGSGTSIIDNCAPEVWVVSQDDKTKDDLTFCDKDGEQKIIRTYYFSDDCGNNSSCTQDIIFLPDTDGPVIECPTLVLIADPHVCHIDMVLPNPTATDGCSGVKKFEHDHAGTQYLVGTTLVTWTAIDSCHNESLPCQQKIIVEDRQSPNIACSADTVCLPLDALGALTIPVDKLYSSVEDNCHLIKSILVEKVGSTVPAAESITFDCMAVGDTCMVRVIATDQSDNSNVCMRTIVVKDVIPPYVVCPPATTVNCEFPLDLADLSNFGTIDTTDITDACGVAGVIELDSDDTGFKCLTGGGVVRTVTRTFEATDIHGNKSTCTQEISVIDDDPFSEDDIMWLPDVQVACGGATSVDSLGQPGLVSDACSQIIFDHRDMVFDLQSEACRRIMRIWTVIDWCQFDRNTLPVAGEWKDTQYIDIVSGLPPTLNGPFADREICVTNCLNGRFQMTFDGAAGCDEFGVFGYLYNIELEDGRVIQSTGNNIDQMLPLGTHNVILTVKDNCHQINTESFKLTVKDCKAPALVCIDGLVVNLMDTDPPMVPLWASDFSNGTKDNCTAESDIIYSFEPDTSVIQRVFMCGEHDRNLGVTIYAMDEHGNQSSCETSIMVQTNGVSCAGFLEQEDDVEEENVETEEESREEEVVDSGSETAMVSGLIANHKGEGIMNTEVNIQGPAMDEYKMTAAAGEYAFESLDMYKDYMVKPSKNDDALNGVSTLDLVLIQKHILGLSVISDPYLRIAADINRSNSVSASDLVELRKLILGSIKVFDNNESWRFVDASYQLDVNDPWNFPEEVEHFNLEDNQMATDFVGIKIGDINGNATTNLQENNVEIRSAEKLSISMDNVSFEKGENMIIGLTTNQDIDLSGMQLALRIDEGLTLVDVISDKLQLSNDQYRIDGNEVLVSWSSEDVANVKEGEGLFKLALRANAKGDLTEAIRLIGDRLSPEAYDEKLDIQELILDVNGEDMIKFELYQNRPNPFIAATEIEFILPKAMEASLIAYDVNGRLLLKKTAKYASGLNRLMITKDELGISSGVIYYRLEAGELTDVKTMILIE